MPLTSTRKQAIARLLDPAAGLGVSLFRAVTRETRRPLASIVADPDAVRRVLVVQLDTIGDVLLREPAVRALRQRFPAAEMHVLASGPGLAVLANHPAIDGTHRYDAAWHRAWRGEPVRWSENLAELRSVLGPLRRLRFDLAIELRGDLRDTMVAALTGAEAVVAAPARGGEHLVDFAVPTPAALHRVDAALRLVEALGAVPPSERAPQVYPSAADRAVAGEMITGNGPWIALGLGAGFASKCLPLATFARIVTGVAARHPAARFVVVGGRDDRGRAATLAAGTPARILDLTGRLSLLQSAAVLERCDVFIGNDSAPMHLAAAVGVPVVALFGPSDPRQYGPVGPGHVVFRTDLACSPCDHVHCVQTTRYLCMQRFGAQPTIEAALGLLGARKRVGASA